MSFEITFTELVYFITLGVLTFFIGLVGTKAFISVMLEQKILAKPNERSMHTEPVPTGAGWVIVLIVMIVYIASYPPDTPLNHWLIPFFTFLLAFMSWYDDKIELSSFLRFGIHGAAVILVLLLLIDSRPIIWDGWPLWVDKIIAGICWLWFINLFNFMDGIDGLAGTEIVMIGIGLLVVGLAISLPMPMVKLSVALVGVTLGFLWSNWHPAKVYLGDTGSIPIGFFLGWLLINLAQEGYLLAALLLPAYFIADASYTILRRLMKGERIWQAHRSHLYQRATMAVKNPAIVVIRVTGANLVLICAALTSISYPLSGLVIGIATLAVLLVHFAYVRRGRGNSYDQRTLSRRFFKLILPALMNCDTDRYR